MSGSGPIDSEKDGKKMKIRKYILCAGIVGLVGMSSGCGQKTDSGATSQAVSEQADTKENAETSGAAGAETEKETAPTVQVVTDDMVPVEADALKDGVYPVEVDSSSSMFHITEAELTVADASSFWVMPRSALASTSLQVIVSVTVFMSISISVFIYMHLQIQNYSGLFRYNNPTVLSVPKKRTYERTRPNILKELFSVTGIGSYFLFSDMR